MMNFATRGLLGVTFIFSTAVTASASVIFDDSARQDFTSGRAAGNSPLAAITVSAPVGIDQIGAMVDLNAAANIKFLIFDLNSATLLFSTTSAAYTDDGLTFKLSPVFSTFTLNPGTTYGIGAIADQGGLWGTNNSSSGNPFTQNNITASDDRNGNVSNFASPGLIGEGSAMIIIELGQNATAVPEPATYTLFGVGFATLGIVIKRRRQQI